VTGVRPRCWFICLFALGLGGCLVTVRADPIVPRAALGPHITGRLKVFVTGPGASRLCTGEAQGQPLCLTNFHTSIAQSITSLLTASIDDSELHSYMGQFEVQRFVPSPTLRADRSALLLLWHFTLRDENRRVVMSLGEESVGKSESMSVHPHDMEAATRHLLEAISDRVRTELELTLREPWASEYR